MEQIRNWFSTPFYVWEYSTKRKIALIILIEAFSVGFKVLYQPDLLKLPFSSNSFFYISHGIVNVLVLVTFLFIIPNIFNGYFKEERRTVFREMVWIFGLFLLLTVSHAVLIIFESNTALSNSLSESLYVNLKIGVFPIALLLILASARGLEIKLQQQELYNAKFMDTSSQNEMISIKGDTETLKITLGDLYYVKSSNNYSQIHYNKDGVVIKKFLRVPIFTIEKELNSQFLFRAHRSYIINFLNVKKVLGNANKCTLLLNIEDIRIPVSRVKRSEMLQALEKLPLKSVA